MGREEGGWTLLGPECRRRWGEKEASELIDNEFRDRPTRDNRSDAEALKKGGGDDGVRVTG